MLNKRTLQEEEMKIRMRLENDENRFLLELTCRQTNFYKSNKYGVCGKLKRKTYLFG